MALYFNGDPTAWNMETATRHKNLPYFKCSNFTKFRQLIKNKKIRDVILEMTDRLVVKFNPDAIILFGSYARESADKYSDVDLLIVFKRKINILNMTSKMIETLKTAPIDKDLVVMSRDELINWSWVKSSIYRDALKYGFYLYEKDKKMSKWFLKESKTLLKNIKKRKSVFSGYKSIQYAMYASIVYDGKELPNTKNLDKICEYVDKSWGIRKFKDDLINFPSGDMLSVEESKLACMLFKTIYDQFKFRETTLF